MKIRNRGSQSQAVHFKGNRVVIGAYEEMNASDEVAKAFFTHYPELIVEVDDDFGGVAQAVAKHNTVWLANMTGNPDAPSKLKVKRVKNKHWEEVEIDNPWRFPIDLKEWAEGEQKEYTDRAGLWATNECGHYVTIPAYKRVELSEAEADWFMTRSIPNGESFIGKAPVKVIISRPPTRFEPSMEWSLDELNAYMQLIDPNVKIGDTEAQLRVKHKKLGKEQLAQKLDDIKRVLLKRLYFRVVDPQYRLPTQAEFKDFINSKAAFEQPKANELEKLVDSATIEAEEAIKNIEE
jgi:hypothetical protein